MIDLIRNHLRNSPPPMDLGYAIAAWKKYSGIELYLAYSLDDAKKVADEFKQDPEYKFAQIVPLRHLNIVEVKNPFVETVAEALNIEYGFFARHAPNLWDAHRQGFPDYIFPVYVASTPGVWEFEIYKASQFGEVVAETVLSSHWTSWWASPPEKVLSVLKEVTDPEVVATILRYRELWVEDPCRRWSVGAQGMYDVLCEALRLGAEEDVQALREKIENNPDDYLPDEVGVTRFEFDGVRFVALASRVGEE